MWPAEPKIWTVAEATRRIEDTLTADPVLQSILIRGEISNYKRHTSGHTYFTLKDAKARLRCVLFRRYGQALSFALGDGLGGGGRQVEFIRRTETISCMWSRSSRRERDFFIMLFSS